jgi:hypothetical protein
MNVLIFIFAAANASRRKRLVDGPLTTLRSEELLAVERSLVAVLGLYV